MQPQTTYSAVNLNVRAQWAGTGQPYPYQRSQQFEPSPQPQQQYSQPPVPTYAPGTTPQQPGYHAPPHPLQAEASTGSSADLQEVDATVKEHFKRMGDLAINLSSAAPYIANEHTILPEIPDVEDVDIVLPPSVGTNSTVMIPCEMMPSEDRAMDYFGYYFEYIHPYVPVLNMPEFYKQW